MNRCQCADYARTSLFLPLSGSGDTYIVFPCASVCLSVCLTNSLSQNLVNATSTVLAGSFWNFADVFFKVWRCAWHLAVILRLTFCYFFFAVRTSSFLGLKHLNTGYLVNATPIFLAGSFWNFAGVFLKVWRCAWHLAVILKLNFVTFSHFELNQFLPKHIGTGYPVNAAPTILPGCFWNFEAVFV